MHVHRLCGIFSIRSQYHSCYFHQLSIFNFPRLDCFSVSPFPKSTSRFLAFLFPISLQLSSLSITHVAFSQFVASLCTRIIYTRWHIPSFLFFLTAPLLPFSNFTDSCRIFPTRCHLFHSCHVHQLSNSPIFSFLFVSLPLVFQFSSFLSMVSEFPYRLSSLGIPFKM